MSVSSINSIPNTSQYNYKGRKIGTGLGFASGVAYIAKNGKEAFQLASKEAAKGTISKTCAYATVASVLGATIAVFTILGRFAGNLIDKVAIKAHNNNN